MGALETLQAKFGCQILFVESGGDNLAANYSRELADYIIYVIDVSVSADLYSVVGKAVVIFSFVREGTKFLAKVDRESLNLIYSLSIRYGHFPCSRNFTINIS
jgi:hypothetical protein